MFPSSVDTIRFGGPEVLVRHKFTVLVGTKSAT